MNFCLFSCGEEALWCICMMMCVYVYEEGLNTHPLSKNTHTKKTPSLTLTSTPQHLKKKHQQPERYLVVKYVCWNVYISQTQRLTTTLYTKLSSHQVMFGYLIYFCVLADYSNVGMPLCQGFLATGARRIHATCHFNYQRTQADTSLFFC